MQELNSQFSMVFLCILCNAIMGCLIILQRKFPAKFNFKLFLILYFGNLILITLFLNYLICITQDTAVLVFEIIEIVGFQVVLVIFTKKVWRHPANLSLFIFSCLIFGILRLSSTYYLSKIVLSIEIFNSVSFYMAFFYQFLFILCISLFSIFILSIFNKIFSKTFAYHSVFSLIWACLFIFAVTPFIDLLLNNLGIIPFFGVRVYSFIGSNLLRPETYGTIILYSFISIVTLIGAISFGYKYGFKFMDDSNLSSPNFNLSNSLMRYIRIGIISAILIGIWYCFISFIDLLLAISIEITVLFGFKTLDMGLVQPFWLLMIITAILLLIPFYCGYLIFNIIKKRKNLWERPNSFNEIPMLNLGILVFSGFILCYNELEYPFTPYLPIYLHRSFILFVIYFYLITFLLLLTVYILTFQKKSWINFSYSLKSILLFIPFFGGYFIAGQMLNTTEILFGFISCASLQIYAIYLQLIKEKFINISHLNRFMIFFWGILSLCFAGLLSITCLLCILFDLILFFILSYYLKQPNTKLITFGLIGAFLLIMGGTSSTFLTTIFALGIPNTIILVVAIFMIIAPIFYIYIRK